MVGLSSDDKAIFIMSILCGWPKLRRQDYFNMQ